MSGAQALDKYRRPGSTRKQPPVTETAPEPEAPSDKEPYEAYKLSKSERRYLEIRQKYPESAEAQSNAMLTNIVGEWRMGLAISLSYGTSMMVKLRGENLQELFRALQEWKVEFIQEFDPESHDAPIDSTKPYIKSIEILTTRPEEPPPMSKRH